METKFFTFRQNNSGGSFETDEKAGIGIYVIIEAVNAKNANYLAEEKGIYFNGCDKGMDCDCCGDRWSAIDESDGENEPKLYGKTLSNFIADYRDEVVFVHYLDKPFEKVTIKQKS